MHAWLRHHGVIYAISSTHLGNSLILFYPHGDKSKSPIPGCIKFIFEQGRLVFTVQRQLEAAQGVLDPFEPYPHFSAKLYSSCLSEELEVVHVDWVLCHFVCWQISSEHVVVLSLSRVSCFGLPFHLTNLITGLIYCISTSSNSRQLNLYITFLLSSSTWRLCPPFLAFLIWTIYGLYAYSRDCWRTQRLRQTVLLEVVVQRRLRASRSPQAGNILVHDQLERLIKIGSVDFQCLLPCYSILKNSAMCPWRQGS